jgi:hypothetical protein
MRSQIRLTNSLATGLLLMVVLLAAACGGSAQATQGASGEAIASAAPLVTIPASTTTVPLPFDALSTFESKDPFVPKVVASKASAVPVSTSNAPGTGATTTTTTGTGATTTTQAPGQAVSTTTTAPSQVSTPLHSLKALSIETVNEQPVVTFEVDDVVYQDRREDDVLSTSWGQIKVVEIDAEAQKVTFLHGSETRVLKVGQEFLK